MNDTVLPKEENGMRVKLQSSGRFLSGMVMPNMGAFIAWGLITALFIPTGWIPNESFAKLVGPMITYLLPLLIGYTGGKIVYETRGGIIATIAVIGIIVGSSIPMFLGAMIVGPLAALGMKKIDALYEGKLPAYSLVGKGIAKQAAPSAIIIHFLGGIHEIYFPYILMNPKLILAAIAGGMTGTLVFSILGAGLVATPSPGSIFAYLAMTPRGGLFPMLAGVTLSSAASFAVAYVLLNVGKQNVDADGLEKAAEKTADLKGSRLKVDVVQSKGIKKIVFACDAGMGSSAMGASILRAKVKKAGLEISVTNASIGEIPGDADVVITHETLTARARQNAPRARHISITDFIMSSAYDELVSELTA